MIVTLDTPGAFDCRIVYKGCDITDLNFTYVDTDTGECIRYVTNVEGKFRFDGDELETETLHLPGVQVIFE